MPIRRYLCCCAVRSDVARQAQKGGEDMEEIARQIGETIREALASWSRIARLSVLLLVVATIAGVGYHLLGR
jgi:hypothetical protein